MFAKSTERDILNNKKENKREDHNRAFCISSKYALMLQSCTNGNNTPRLDSSN